MPDEETAPAPSQDEPTGNEKTEPANTPTDVLQGFPPETALKDMTIEQQAAYWRHHAQKHEKAWKSRLPEGMDLDPDGLKALLKEHESLKRDSMSASDKAIADAKAEGIIEGRSKAEEEQRKRSLGYLDGHIDALISARGLKRDDYEDYFDTLDRSKFLTAEGDVDTAKVARVIGGALGATERLPRNPDMGQGNRGTATAATGIEAGRALYEKTHSAKQ